LIEKAPVNRRGLFQAMRRERGGRQPERPRMVPDALAAASIRHIAIPARVFVMFIPGFLPRDIPVFGILFFTFVRYQDMA
jgi:hypothetical protein